MKNILTVSLILLSIALTGLIFLQSQDDDNNRNILSRPNFEKRGWEKITFFITIAIGVIFILLSIIQTFI